MTYILGFLIVTLPLIIVTNKFDCFRTIKESVFQVGCMVILGMAFFDRRRRDYKNRWICYLLIFIGIMFFRHFSIAYIWGNDHYKSVMTAWHMMPVFNIILGVIALKTIIEYVNYDHIEKLIKLSCYVTLLVSVHMILQKCNIFQMYGYDVIDFQAANMKGWLASNRVIGLMGNPMIIGGYVAITSQFNLFFREKHHYVMHGISFVAILCTATTSPIIAFVLCFLVWLWFQNKRLAGVMIFILLLVVTHMFINGDFGGVEALSDNGRVQVWKESLKLWKQMPYTGLGLGNFRTHKIEVLGTQWWQAHNEPIQLLHEVGIIGCGIIFVILLNFFKGNWKDHDLLVCRLVILSGIIYSGLSFPLHIAPLVYMLMLGFGFGEILKEE